MSHLPFATFPLGYKHILMLLSASGYLFFSTSGALIELFGLLINNAVFQHMISSDLQKA